MKKKKQQSNIIGIAGGGKIGKAIYHLLIDGDICSNVVVMDIVPRPDDIAESDYVQTDGTFEEFVKDKTLIINALPFTKNKELWLECFENKVAYFDMSEDDDLDHRLGLFHDHDNMDIPFTMPHCGLAPGISTIIANSLLQEQDTATNVKIRVGALSSNSTNKLKYHTSWSGEGLVNEYRGDCQVLRDGKLKVEPALSGYETITLDGIEYEAFNTSGGIGTLAWTLSKSNNNLNVDYKTLRRVGHHNYADFLFNDLALTEKELINIFKNHVPSTQNDCVLIYVQAGDREYYKKFTPTVIEGRRYTAIELTTAIGLVSVVELYLNGKTIPYANGYYNQERIKFEDILKTTYGKVYYDG
jgi:saccharopine dehydrogenase-like NADP-dependent oxidoreductase